MAYYKLCQSKYYKKNKEAYFKRNKECLERLQSNPEKWEEYKKKRREYSRVYRRKNREKINFLKRKKGKYLAWTHRNRKEIISHYNNKCMLCNKKRKDNDFELHHVIYQNNIFSIKPLCPSCHKIVHNQQLVWDGNEFI